MSGTTRRVKGLILAVILVVSSLGPRFTSPAAKAGGIGPITTTLAYPVPPVLASAVAVLDADTGKWLRLYNADTPLPMASTTKIMTAILAIEDGRMQDLVTVSHAAASVGQSTMGLVEGEQVTMHDLLYGLLLPSGNDAAIAIAEHVSGSVPRFVALMNARALELGLSHTHFVTPYGFSDAPDGDDPSHYSSARDLVLLAQYAMRYPLFRQVVGTAKYVVPKTMHNQEHDLATVNYFLNWYPGADGVKPGWTSGAGVCQVLDVRRNGRHLIAAILHTSNVYSDARDLMNYTLGEFKWIPSGFANDTPDQVIVGGTKSEPEWYFSSSGHSIQGAMLRYYKTHGGFAVIGAPQTESVNIDGTQEQFFTDQVLIYGSPGGGVVPLRLGYSAVPATGWLIPVPKQRDSKTARYYLRTGHTVTNRFLKFYLGHGGPSTFGYPISEKRDENGTLVQYFDNAELVWHAQPDDYHGYVGVAPLGVRSLVQLGLMTGEHLPKALHSPYQVAAGGPTPRSGPADITPQPALRKTSRVESPRPSLSPEVSLTGTPSATAHQNASPSQTLNPTAARTYTATPTSIATPGIHSRSPTPTATPAEPAASASATTTSGSDTPVPLASS